MTSVSDPRFSLDASVSSRSTTAIDWAGTARFIVSHPPSSAATAASAADPRNFTLILARLRRCPWRRPAFLASPRCDGPTTELTIRPRRRRTSASAAGRRSAAARPSRKSHPRLRRKQGLPLHALADQLTGSADGLGLLARL